MEIQNDMTDCLRIAVDCVVDRRYITGHTVGDDEERPVRVDCIRQPYLCEIACPGDRLNLIRPVAADDGAMLPELAVYQPDYLVNISQIAGCFESYTTSATVSLIKKVSPAPDNEAVCLGNFASQLLDEAVHHPQADVPYADSIRTFFGRNALALACSPVSAAFHRDARRQRDIIRRALLDGVADCGEVMLEPSFIAERLGLQGRMDLLSLDYTLLIEQKAGKGAWPHDFGGEPRAALSHHVQLLLYMALIRYAFPDRYGRLQAMLLYSKYSRPLLAPGYAPALLAEAMRVRNMIVAQEYDFTRRGFAALETLDIDSLNTAGPSVLWDRYTRPRLEALLGPLSHASATERAYYRRMTRFVATEHMLSKVGTPGSGQAAGLASVWRSTPAEKADSGCIIAELTLVSPQPGSPGPVERLTLRLSDPEAALTTDFRPGDIVILYSYRPGEQPDACSDMIFRCSLRSLAAGQVVLDLRCPQSGTAPFDRRHGCLWAIEHDFMESSYSSLYRGLHALLSAPQQRRDLLLMQRRPRVDHTRRLHGDYGEFNEPVLRSMQSRDLFMIIGPPGTGKTSLGLMNTLREALTDPATSVLLLAYTNRAVDEICSKLVEADIDFMRIGSELSCNPRYTPMLAERRARDCADVGAVRRMIADTRVVTGTVASLNARIALLGIKHFDLAIIDEASQLLEPHLAGLLAATTGTRPAIGRIVMIGDHRQLPAVVRQRPAQSAVDDPLLHAIGLHDCRNSLFERLLSRYGHDPEVTYMLCRQGRMHRDIADFPNRAFYGGRLTEAVPERQTVSLPPCHGTDPLDRIAGSSRVAFVNVVPGDSDTGDKSNLAEARLIAAITARVARMYPTRAVADTVGIIVPYRNQISTIRAEIARTRLPGGADITVDTVERFQGSQRPVIIYGFTVSRPDQLDFLTDNIIVDEGVEIDRKLNVAMTRAREHLVMVGNARLLATVPLLERLVSYVKEVSGYYEVPENADGGQA